MERVRLVARRREGGEGGQEGDVGGGAEDVEGEEMKKDDEGREKREEEEDGGDVMEVKKGTVVQGNSHMPGRPKMPSSRYPPPSAATATAAIEPIVQRY
ncbi:hypothetical protein D0863_15999 [Hortaea werneckii]|uniref:Uncharacterized protein n=1 Tax=Hortaea werneckii TaxID=91943 RepID=A0A3M7C0T7_HORWE|nr:hypothetical protein D0863_15999 [Hortaea werneckii]